MKTPPLLFSLPLLLSVLAVQSLPADAQTVSGEGKSTRTKTTTAVSVKESEMATVPPGDNTTPLAGPGGVQMWPTAEGVMMRLPIRGSRRLMQVMTNQFHVTEANGKQKVMRLTATETLEGITSEMTMTALTGGVRTDLVAYDPDLPQTDATKLLITPRVVVVLQEGMSFSAFANNSGALGAMRPGWAPECLILSYATAMDAIGAAAELSRKAGVAYVEHVVASRRVPEFIPTEAYFSGGGPAYQPAPLTDNVDTFVLVPLGSSAYQWWANNRATAVGPVNSVPAKVSLGDYPPIGYNPNLPAVHGEQSDLRLPPAWEHPASLGSACPRICGNRVPVLIVDDGIQNRPATSAHRDLQNAVDTNLTHHKNYIQPRVGPYEFPLSATNPIPYSHNADPYDTTTDTHGTSLAGIIGARQDLTGYGITGVAPGCLFQAAVVDLRGYIADDAFSDAFALGSNIQDSIPRNNSLLDEVRSGNMNFKVCLSAIGFLGTQDAVRLYPESWLWKRAVRHGATRGNNFKGIVYVTSAGNGGYGHMNVNYMEHKNIPFMITVAGVSELGRRIATSNRGCSLVTCAPTWGFEMPPALNWSANPGGNFGTRPIKVNPPVEVDDLPPDWWRFTQGVPTIATTNHAQNPNFDFNFSGTSASAAEVTGIVALMLEANDQLGARDVKEILLRSSRVCNDARSTYHLAGAGLWDTQWRMSRTGNPMHYAFGAGLVDANLAIKMAKQWKSLPVSPYVPRQISDVTAESFGKFIGSRTTETGGIYLQVSARQLIPLNINGTDPPVEILLPSPPAGMRLEHIEVRVRFYHQRRGDLEIKLIAPGEMGWEHGLGNIYLGGNNGVILKEGDPGWQPGRPMESDLYVPHREDYTESRWDQNVPELRDPTDWTFTTVRHWGTRVPTTNPGAWKLRIRDAVSRGATPVGTPDDPVQVSKPNPTNVQTQRMEDVAITYHGVVEKTEANDPPVVLTRSTKARFAPSTEMVSTILATEPLDRTNDGTVRFPVTNWDLFNTVDIAPRQPSNPPREFFEFTPPLIRDPLDPAILIPLDNFPPFFWVPEPLQRIDNPWVPWLFLPEPVSGPQGGMAIRPAWGPKNPAGQRTPVQMTADKHFIVVHEIDKKTGLEKPNAINLRLNRGTGQLDIVPLATGIYQVNAYVENLVGMSMPKPIQITVALPNYKDWTDIWWDPPQLNDPLISGFYADPDGDRLPNGLEFAMRTDPTQPQPSDDPLPAFRIEGNEVVFTYREDITLIGVKLHAQVSEDLRTWSDVNPEPTVLGETNGLRDMEVRLALVDDKTFFRLWAQDLTNPNDPPPPAP